MEAWKQCPIAIVGVGAILPDALDVPAFWENILTKKYSITEVPPERWCIEDYYHPDPTIPDKTYSKIGGWVRGFQFDWKTYRIPPKVAAAMDRGQQWAVATAAQALADFGYPERSLDTERVGVILGTAMGGEQHYQTFLRISFPEYLRRLQAVPEFRQLPAATREAIEEHWHQGLDGGFPGVSEDSMPGELPNIVSGRIANVFNLRGPNFITDAACASALAAVEAASQLLDRAEVDAVLTGGVDHNMGASTFVKFCKVGALSATGTRPFGEGADGFVMGEGAVSFLLKRLEDAERDGDPIYAVIRGVGGAGDGKGKGITAPNPLGQQLAMRRAWANANLDPATATLIEAHGTSTKVGDVVEVESLAAVFGQAAAGSIGLGSVKSNLGHLKAGAGAAGMLKAVLALHHGILPPTLNAHRPNPDIDFNQTPFSLLQEAREWVRSNGVPRRCGVSAYGFGGTNFHLVLEEHLPGRLTNEKRSYEGVARREPQAVLSSQSPSNLLATSPQPPQGILALGAATVSDLHARVEDSLKRVQAGWVPPAALPDGQVLADPERLVIDFASAGELQDRLAKAEKSLSSDQPGVWKALQAQGIFRGRGRRPGKMAFLFPGQGSQYINMGRELKDIYPVVAQVFAEADQVLLPILGRPLSEYIFVEAQDVCAMKAAEGALTQTSITQPAMITLDVALYRLLQEFGFQPEMVMGHSLGEYAALVVAGVLPFADALEAVAARGREMTRVSVEDNGWMAAVMAPYVEIEKTLQEVEGYVVAANINSYNQCVIGGASQAVEKAIQLFQSKGYNAVRIQVSHAFHTRIVAPASIPLRQVLDRLQISPPRLPLVANVTGEFYPTTVEAIKDILQQQIASPVQWVKGLETLYAAGARAFVEVGPKRALKGFAEDVLGSRPDTLALLTNHPKNGASASLNQALCGLFAAGYGQLPRKEKLPSGNQIAASTVKAPVLSKKTNGDQKGVEMDLSKAQKTGSQSSPEKIEPALNHLTSKIPSVEELAHRLAQAFQNEAVGAPNQPYDRNSIPLGSVVITGTGLGLPGAEKAVMDPKNAQRILNGEQFVDLIPERFRKRMLAKRVTRLIKGEDGSGHFEVINNPDEVVKLAGRPGSFDLGEEYGVPEKLVEALDITSQLAMAAGLDALREAGIPLVQIYKRTSTGKFLPDRWLLPESLRDETGVIFASAFPGGDRFADELSRYFTWENRLSQLHILEDLAGYSRDLETRQEIDRRLAALRSTLEHEPYEFDRRFLFRVLAMGHSQFAEYIGARGPNTQINAACASTAQGVALAEDWIRTGRCRRVIVIGADAVTSENLMEWVGAGFLATGAVAIDDRIEEAALPFDRRRHGTLMGMGACALLLESEDAVRERGMRGIVELLSSEINNSAFHGTRLDVEHIAHVMNSLLTSAERRFGITRYAIAPQMVFMSHETYTPARGGSASAEVVALRNTFGEAASEVVVANTKGFTGHPMGVGVEDVIAVKILEYGIVPPVPNFKEVDPELGPLNLSRGGRYPVQYALHLAAGFGSQIAMTLVRRIPGAPDRLDQPARYQRWLAEVSGYDWPETEVVKRVLRVKSPSAPQRPPGASTWIPGQGPSLRAITAGDGRSYVRPEILAPAAPEEVSPASGHSPYAAQPGNGAAPKIALPQPGSTPDEPLCTAAPDPDPILQKILAIVAEKTGYPVEMLEPDLDMEADLGIDTVKQAETFVAIREAFDLPRPENLRLRDYPTLAHVARFVNDQVIGKIGVESLGSGEEKTPISIPQPLVSNPELLASLSTGPILQKILAIVAEKTGYPVEMLEPDLDMEADLGIDTVKQAETFVAIREEFNIPPQENLKLRDYPTLAHVVQFVREKGVGGNESGDRGSGVDKTPASTSIAQPPIYDPVPLAALPLENADQFPRRVPVPVLRPALEVCKTTGVVLEPGARVIIASDEGEAGAALAGELLSLGVEVLALDTHQPGEVVEAQAQAWLKAGPIQGVYWLPGLDEEPPLDEMNLEGWRGHLQRRVKNLYRLMRTLYDAIQAPGTFLITATRLGGLHGYGETGASAPLGGAVTGFAKAYQRERPGSLVKVVDLEAGAAPQKVAQALIEETLYDPGAVEVGHWRDDRFAITLLEQPLGKVDPQLQLDRETVFLVTGAAGSITSAVVSDLALASGGTFYLLDLAELPENSSQEINLFRSDKEACKQRLIATAKDAGERPTPARIDKLLLSLERQEAALRAVEAVEAAGGKAYYHSLDLLDPSAVTAVIEEIRARNGRIDVVIHAAGLEISRSLADKDPAQFDLVFDVKTEGYFNLLRAGRSLPVGTVLVFSSVAGRFGNAGQTDYSAANDLLCKLSRSLPRWRPGTRGLAIDWTAWSGIGMAARGSISKVMEQAGIDMLAPEVGTPTVRRELLYNSGGQEVVVGGGLGILMAEKDLHGGLDLEKANRWLAKRKPSHLAIGCIKSFRLYGGLEVETTLDPAAQPFLHDHAIDGIPILPGVMGGEVFAELAACLAPGYIPVAIEKMQFERPFKFYHRQPQSIYLSAEAIPAGDGELLVKAVLRSITRPARTDLPVQEKVHFRGQVRLARDLPVAPPVHFNLPDSDPITVTADQIYQIYFHGPSYQVLERAQIMEAGVVGLMAQNLPPDTQPAEAASYLAPRYLELCFQAAGLWEMKKMGRLALPFAYDGVTIYRQPEESGKRFYALVQSVRGSSDDLSFDAQVVGEDGEVYLALRGYRSVPLPGTLAP